MGASSWQRYLTGFALGLLVLSGSAVAADLQQQIDDCAVISNDNDRLVCFDALASASDERYASTGMQPSAAPAEISAAATGSTESKTAADSPAQSPPIIAPEPARGEEREEEVFAVRLTRCTESSVSGRQVYYLDNGEVWRQSNSRRKNIQNCDTPVTIMKDLFGFKMHVPSEGRSIRISPVR